MLPKADCRIVIVLQMFIAVINENFNVAEESKKGQQATHYWATQKPETGHVSWIRRLNPYRWVKAAPVSVKVENLPSSLVLPMQKALVQDYNMGSQDRPTAVCLPKLYSRLCHTYSSLGECRISAWRATLSFQVFDDAAAALCRGITQQ